MGGGGNDVTIRFDTPGAKEAAKTVQDITAAMVTATKASQENHAIQQAMVQVAAQHRGGIMGIVDSLKNLHASYEQGTASGGGMNGVMNVMNATMSAALSPVGLVSAALGVVAISLTKVAESAMETYRAMRQLQAMSGMTAEAAEVMSNAFKLAGAEDISVALFRMSNQVETGGKMLQRFGVSIRDQQGDLKSEGALLMEVRDMIGELGDASQRNATLLQLFGRAGRSMAPAFARSREEFAKYIQISKERSGVDEQFMAQAKKYQETMTELSLAWDKTKLAIASTIALPVMQFFADLTKWTMSLYKGGLESLTRGFFALKAVFTGQIFSKEGRDALVEMFALPAKAAQEAVPKTEGAVKRLTDSEAQQNMQRLRQAQEFHQKELAGDQAFAAEKQKLETGSETASIRSRVALNEKLIEEARDLHRQQREELLKVTPDIDKETEFKLRKELDDKILGLTQENRLATLKIKQSEAADSKRVLDDRINAQKAANAQLLANMSVQRDAELAINQETVQSSVKATIERNRIEERFAVATANTKIDALKKEENQLKDYAAQYPESFAVQQEVQRKLLDLGTQRANAEREANTAIINSRRQMVEQLKQEANKEAGLGDQLTSKALENLKKRGRTRASQEEIIQEATEIRRKGQETLGGGGRMRIEDIQSAMGMRGMFQGLNQMGSTISGAVGQSFGQTGDAFAGIQKNYMPSNVTMGAGGPQYREQTDSITDAYKQAFEQVPAIVDKSLTQIGERIDRGWKTVEEKLTDKIVENITRKLEFEAARS
jgi:hypothetical protein